MDFARKSTTAESCGERIITQQKSGESVRGWCQQNGCHEHSFYWWRTRLGLSQKSAAQPRGKTAKPIAFAEEVIGPPSTTVQTMKLRLRGGHELTLPAMPVERLAQRRKLVQRQ